MAEKAKKTEEVKSFMGTGTVVAIAIGAMLMLILAVVVTRHKPSNYVPVVCTADYDLVEKGGFLELKVRPGQRTGMVKLPPNEAWRIVAPGSFQLWYLDSEGFRVANVDGRNPKKVYDNEPIFGETTLTNYVSVYIPKGEEGGVVTLTLPKYAPKSPPAEINPS